MDTDSKKRPPSFKLSIPGDDQRKNSILSLLSNVREILVRQFNHPVNNGDIIENALTAFLEKHRDIHVQTNNENMDFNTYVQVQEKDSNQRIFLTAEESLKRLVTVAENHAKLCKGRLVSKKLTEKGHVAAVRFNCSMEKSHSLLWSSSPYLPNNEYLVNRRVMHGFACSGMLPVHYMRFAKGANIGVINQKNREQCLQKIYPHVEEEYKESIDLALWGEVGCEEDDGITIMTDARHGWRKNAKDSSIVAIGEKTHRVIKCEHVTKQDDHVSQRHEKIGTERIYEFLDEQGVDVNVHIHDRNLSINKLVKSKGNIINQNDSWHGVKPIKEKMKKVSSGPAYSKGKTWSEDLQDKVEPVATHCHWALRNCDQDPEKLKKLLLNTVEHYKGNHSDCHSSSRCKLDKNYEPSRVVLVDKVSEKLLRNVIVSSNLYKYPEDYVLAKDTYYVESFNNTMNIFQDKRIAFGDHTYRARSHLAVCHWNENVDRVYTSVWNPRRPDAPRSSKGKKVYKVPTYTYRDNIWRRQISALF